MKTTKLLSKIELRALAAIVCAQHADKIVRYDMNARRYTESEMRERAIMTRDERKAHDALKDAKRAQQAQIAAQ